MGGSGGGSSSSGGGSRGGAGGGASSGGHASGSLDCTQVSFETSVGSPHPTVLAEIVAGDVCDVVLLSDPTRIAVLTQPHGDVLGAIVSRWEDLVGCIAQGFQFEAVVLTVSSPVRVLVRPAP